MDNKEEEYADESMFQSLSDTTLRTDATHNDEPINDLEYRFGMTTPDSRKIFDDIGRDMMLANLTEEEMNVIRIKSNLIRDLEFIESHNGLGKVDLRNLFRHDREVILISSLSREGFLRDNLISQIKKFRLDRQKKDQNKSKLRFGFGKQDNDSD